MSLTISVKSRCDRGIARISIEHLRIFAVATILSNLPSLFELENSLLHILTIDIHNLHILTAKDGLELMKEDTAYDMKMLKKYPSKNGAAVQDSTTNLTPFMRPVSFSFSQYRMCS
jgi:hypothetical protein